MGDNKSASDIVPFGRNESKGFAFQQQATANGDSKLLSEKDDTTKSLNSEPTRRSRKRTFRTVRKIPSDTDDAESTSEKKKKKMKGDAVKSEESFQFPETQKQIISEKKTGTEDRIKSFASKGAASKSVIAVQAQKNAGDEERRRVEISVIQSRIQPTEDETNEHLPTQHSRILYEPALPKQQQKRQSEIMQQEILKAEQEDEALANLVLNLVKLKREEKEEEAHIALTESKIFKKSMNMSPMEQAGIVCVLEEAVAELNILGFTHDKPFVKPEIKYISLQDKLAEKEHSDYIDLIKSNKSPEEYEKEKQLIKLQKDRGFLEEALNLTLLEMKNWGTFKILQDIVHLEEEMKKEEADIRFIRKNRQQEVNHYKALMENEQRKAMKKLDNRAALLTLIKDEIQDINYYNGLKFRYVDHWESSRAEQHKMTLQNQEKDLNRQLLDYEQRINIETRCSAEMKALIEKDIASLSDKIEEWMKKHETEMEDRENKLSKLKEEREEHLKQLKDKTDLFHERQRQIDEWKAYKEKKRLQAEHEALLNRMATHIQAWWRGTMVRRHLGPFKKLKHRHGKRHNKKKKK